MKVTAVYPTQCRYCDNLVTDSKGVISKGIICYECKKDKRLRGIPETSSECTDFVPTHVMKALQDMTPDYTNSGFLISIIDRVARDC